MENTTKISTEESRIQDLLAAYLLSRRTLKSSAAETSFHVDEDFLTAFTQGNLSERESTPVISHLVDCGFCRHKTAELVRLDLAFSVGEEEPRTVEAAEPNKISEVLSGLFTKIFGSAEGAVFAHNEKEPEEQAATEDDDSPRKG